MKLSIGIAIGLFIGTVLTTAPGLANDSPPVPVSMAEPQYRKCSVTTDCATYVAPCSAPVAVNAKSKAVFDKMGHAGRHNCRVAKINPANMPVCENGYCALRTFSPAGRPDTKAPRYCNTVQDCQIATDHCGHSVALNKNQAAIKQAQFNAVDPRSGCEWVEKRPLMRMECKANTCQALLDNYPKTPPSQ